jgi:hypothetical protein
VSNNSSEELNVQWLEVSLSIQNALKQIGVKLGDDKRLRENLIGIEQMIKSVQTDISSPAAESLEDSLSAINTMRMDQIQTLGEVEQMLSEVLALLEVGEPEGTPIRKLAVNSMVVNILHNNRIYTIEQLQEYITKMKQEGLDYLPIPGIKHTRTAEIMQVLNDAGYLEAWSKQGLREVVVALAEDGFFSVLGPEEESKFKALLGL